MGLLGVKAECIARSPLSFKQGMPSAVPAEDEKDDDLKCVCVKDFMPDIYRFAGKGVCMTTAQLAGHCVAGINEWFRSNRNAAVYVLRADIRKFMPMEKIVTQIKRLETAQNDTFEVFEWSEGLQKYVGTKAFVPFCKYPPGCTVTDRGVLHPDGKTLEPIYVRRLMMTRYLRVKFYSFLENFVSLEENKWCDAVTLIFEWRTDDDDEEDHAERAREDTWSRPSIFTRAKGTDRPDWYFMEDLVAPVHREATKRVYRNQLGEADLAVVWWMKHLTASWPNARLLLHTKDSDSIPLLVYHFWDHPKPIVWMYQSEQYMDLLHFIHGLKTRGMSRDVFMAACVLSGTDFFKKSLATDGIGHSVIWDVAYWITPHLTAAVDTAKGFGELVRMMWYRCKVKQEGPKPPPKPRAKKGEPKPLPVPKEARPKPLPVPWPTSIPSYDRVHAALTPAAQKKFPRNDLLLSAAYSDFYWNHQYWVTLHDGDKCVHLPVTEASKAFVKGFTDARTVTNEKRAKTMAENREKKRIAIESGINPDAMEDVALRPLTDLEKVIQERALKCWDDVKSRREWDMGLDACKSLQTDAHVNHIYETNHKEMKRLSRIAKAYPNACDRMFIKRWVAAMPVKAGASAAAAAAGVRRVPVASAAPTAAAAAARIQQQDSDLIDIEDSVPYDPDVDADDDFPGQFAPVATTDTGLAARRQAAIRAEVAAIVGEYDDIDRAAELDVLGRGVDDDY